MFLTLEKGLKELTMLTLSFSINSFSSCALFLSSDWLYFLLKCAFHTSAVYNTSITPLSAFNSEILYTYTEGQQIFFNLVLK